MLIGITGTIGSGKDTAMHYIGDAHGFTVRSGSKLIREEASKRGMGTDRDSLHVLANQLRDESAGDYFTEALINGCDCETDNVVMGMIRTSSGLHYFREAAPNGKIIAIDTPVEVRYERVVGRGEERDNIDFETFKRQEQKEMHSNNARRHNISYCMEHSDYLIMNDGTLDEFYTKIDDVVRDIKSG